MRAHMLVREEELKRQARELQAQIEELRRDRARYREMAIRLTYARVAREAPYLLRDLVEMDCPAQLPAPVTGNVTSGPRSWWPFRRRNQRLGATL